MRGVACMKTGISVIDAMTKKPVTADPDMTVQQCAIKMRDGNINSMIIQKDGHIEGIFTDEDIVHKVVAAGRQPSEVACRDVMSRSVITISPDADLYEAMVQMRDSSIRHLPVTDGDELIGFLTMKDILKIEPDLFDLIVEHFEIREEETKPINREPAQFAQVQVCESCGSDVSGLQEVYGTMMCEECRENQMTRIME